MRVCIGLTMLATYFCPWTGGALILQALSAFSKVELRFPFLFEDAAIGPLLQECRILIEQQ